MIRVRKKLHFCLNIIIFLSKIFNLSKKFVHLDTLLKLKKIYLYIGQGSVKNVILFWFVPQGGRCVQNLLLITCLNVIGAVFNFKVIGKVVD